MPTITVDRQTPDPEIIQRAAGLLRSGRLVAFPTETVYGLGANALDPDAVDRIYAAKGRPAYNPLIVHLARAELARTVVSEWPDKAEMLANVFWPGPITLVLPKQPVVPDSVTAGLSTVGVRVPAHPVALALLEAAHIPVAAPSANRSNELSPTTGAHVEKSLGDVVDLILDAGPTSVGIESTVIDLTGQRPTVLRPGTISIPDIERVIGPVLVAGARTGDEARPSPGMLEKHYAPKARVMIAEAADVGLRVEQIRARSQRAGAIIIWADVEESETMRRLPADARGYAASLYQTLHALDDAGCDVVVVERVPESPDWLGVRDRLERATR
jgi:L-threonylcarbamoyladenylate synthase